MNVSEVRRANLRTLVAKYESQKKLAELVGTHPVYISQILSDKSRAKIGDTLAREIEKKLNLDEFWFDTDHTKAQIDTVPIYDLEDVSDVAFHRKLKTKIRAQEVVSGFSDLAFAFRVSDNSMSPEIRAGANVIVEPSIEPAAELVVLLADEKGKMAVIRRVRVSIDNTIILIPGDSSGLKPEVLPESLHIAGVVVESISRTSHISQAQPAFQPRLSTG
jgi:SOS-response transcriptional repressor LexA